MVQRTAQEIRKTNETEISAKLNIDGTKERKINTGIGLLDHMLDLFAYWGHFDLEIIVKKGDFNIDIHHTNEDAGIVLGKVFKKALGKKAGIKRIGCASVPMEDVTATVTLDISGRSFFKRIQLQRPDGFLNPEIPGTEEYSLEYADHFFESFAKNLGLNLIIELKSCNRDLHTNLEPIFKGLGIALDQATQIDPRRKGIPSTKGVIDQ